MRKKYKGHEITAMIPARMGSQRLAVKNLALLGGRPLISYAIAAAGNSGVFKNIIVNSESDLFRTIALRYKVDFYKRPESVASSTTKSDHVVYDFVKNNPCDIVVWVNPISPLQTGEEIRQVIDHFIKERLDSLITVKNEQVHSLYKGKAVNFSEKGVFEQTQNLEPVQLQVYSIMMWRTETFMRKFEKDGFSVLSGKVGYFPVSKLSSIIVKRKEDLILAECALKVLSRKKGYNVLYDRILKKE